jgi:hypothetical protein
MILNLFSKHINYTIVQISGEKNENENFVQVRGFENSQVKFVQGSGFEKSFKSNDLPSQFCFVFPFSSNFVMLY